MMHRWTVKGRERLTLPGTQKPDAHFDGRRKYDHQVKEWLEQFLDLWLVSKAGVQTVADE